MYQQHKAQIEHFQFLFSTQYTHNVILNSGTHNFKNIEASIWLTIWRNLCLFGFLKVLSVFDLKIYTTLLEMQVLERPRFYFETKIWRQ